MPDSKAGEDPGASPPPETAPGNDVSSNPAPEGGGSRVLQPHVEEIQRRRDCVEHSLTFDKSGNCTLPLHLPGQGVALLSTSHVSMAPRCSDVDNPGIIFYGVFEDTDDARNFVGSQEYLRSGRVNVQVHPLHTWGMLASNADRLQDANVVHAHIDKVLAAHREVRNANDVEFEENHAERKTGEGTVQAPSKVNSFAHKTELRDCKKVPSSGIYGVAPPYGQKVAVVSFVTDLDGTDAKEPLFNVYGVFDSETEADCWIRHVLADHVTDVDIDVVACCQWLFPQNVKGSDVGKEVFRGDELNKIMQHHKSEPSRISNFEEWKKRQGESDGGADAS